MSISVFPKLAYSSACQWGGVIIKLLCGPTPETESPEKGLGKLGGEGVLVRQAAFLSL